MNQIEAYAKGPQGWGNYSVRWVDGAPEWEAISRQTEAILIPGLTDLHIHGGYGVDVMSSTTGQLADLAHQLNEEGIENWLPTTITGSAEHTAEALARLPQHPSIKGFHLEGPFISPSFPGAQPEEHIASPASLSPKWEEILGDPRLRLITLAPEVPGALPLVERLSRKGVIVSMGHTNASFREAQAGIEAGCTHATHCFNAMRPFHHREAGTVGCVLVDDRVCAELIYDRIHVSPDSAKLLFKSKPIENIVGISDGSMACGLAAGTELSMWGHECIVGDHEVRLKSSGALAGSAVNLRTVFTNLAEDFGIEAAAEACAFNPRRRLEISEPPRIWMVLDLAFGLQRLIRC